MRPRLIGLTLVLVVLVLATASPPTEAGPAVDADIVAVSGATPFPDGCGNEGDFYESGEVEPMIAVNPTNPENIVVVWQQDRFRTGGGALSNVIATSFDGGQSFQQVLVPGISACTGGVFDRATDPWLSFGGDGTVYLASLTIREGTILTNAVVVNSSIDGGLTWSEPAVVAPSDFTNDKEQITAHPTEPGKAYVVWSKIIPYDLNDVVCCQVNSMVMSKTEDGGKTWSLPFPIFTSIFYTIPYDGEIFVLDDGTLVCVFQLNNPSDQVFPEGTQVPILILSSRSADDGVTWSPPVIIGTTTSSGPVDPDSNLRVNHPIGPSSDIGPDGTLYVSWPDTVDPSQILFSRSDDGGNSWIPPGVVAEVPAQAFTPSLAVAGDGTVGITYYDFRHDLPGDEALTTEVWFAHSHDRGGTWHEIHVGGPFDMRTAPSKGDARFVGDYSGLAGLPEGFAAAFGMAQPAALIGPSDIFFGKLVPAQ